MKKVVKNLFVVLLIIGVFVGVKVDCYASEVKYTDNVIPKMTSNTSPSGVASASSELSIKGSIYAWTSFNHNNIPYDGWVAEKKTTINWIEYNFKDLKCIEKYTMISRRVDLNKPADVPDVLSQLPKDWTFEAWDEEQSKWVILDVQSNVTDWEYCIKKEFTFSNTKSYHKYRIYITKDNGTDYATSIGEIEMMETASDKNILKVVMEPKESIQLSVDDDLDENLNMTWTSSDDSIATVDANGVVTALKKGNATITVTSKDGKYTDKIHILVVDDAKDLRLAIDMKAGTKRRVTIDDLTDTKKVTWTSMDPEIATIDGKGRITAVKKGLVLITATDENGEIVGTVYVRVRN